MSFKLVETVKDIADINGKRLTPAEKSVLLWMAFRANEDGDAWPGPTSIASALNINERTVRRAIEALRKMKLITNVGNGRRGVSVYQINPGPYAPLTTCPPGKDYDHPGQDTLLTPGFVSQTPGDMPPKQKELNKLHPSDAPAPQRAQITEEVNRVKFKKDALRLVQWFSDNPECQLNRDQDNVFQQLVIALDEDQRCLNLIYQRVIVSLPEKVREEISHYININEPIRA